MSGEERGRFAHEQEIHTTHSESETHDKNTRSNTRACRRQTHSAHMCFMLCLR